jgi:hypothetical protein
VFLWLHSVLTYKIKNGQIGCINRDENAVNNIIKIVNYYLNKKERPLAKKDTAN